MTYTCFYVFHDWSCCDDFLMSFNVYFTSILHDFCIILFSNRSTLYWLSGKVFNIIIHIIFAQGPLFRWRCICFCGIFVVFCRQNPLTTPISSVIVCEGCAYIMYILLEIYIFILNCLRLPFRILLSKIYEMETKRMKLRRYIDYVFGGLQYSH